MSLQYFFALTGLLEAATGLALLILPAFPLELLLGLAQEGPATVYVIARLTGGAFLALGVACWLARNDQQSQAHFGLLVGILIYDAAAAALLAYAALALDMAGIALWPAAALHSIMVFWGILCLKSSP